jgi:hypothetical protein
MSLSTSSINSAYPLAAIVTRSGKTLAAVEGSALGDCLAACDDGFDGIVVDGTPFVSDEPAQDQVAANAGEEHSFQCEQLVEHAAKAVAYTMDIARNQVNPQIKRVVDATEAYIDAKRSARLAPMLINPVFTADIYGNADLQDLLSKHAESLHKDIPAQVISAKWKGNGAAVGDIYTGIPSLDAEVAKHFEGREGQVQDLWERYFSNVPGKYRSADYRHDVNSNDDALVLFLGANSLLNGDVPEGLNTDLAGYRAYVGGIKDQAGANLTRRLKNHKNATEANQLVFDAPQPTRPGEVVSGSINVNGDVYNKWLEAGGSPEALMGACLSGGSLSYNGCLQNAASTSTIWERHLSGLNAQAVFEQRGNTIGGLRQAIIEVGKDVYASFNDGRTFNVSELNDRLSALTQSDLDNLYAVARTLVCDLFFSHTDAKAFLQAFDDAAVKNAGSDASEVAMQVATDYVTHWVAAQMTVSGEFITHNN